MHFTHSSREMITEEPEAKWYKMCSDRPKMVTQVKVVRASGLEHQDKAGGADPYCIIKCEGEKVGVALKLY